MKVIRHLVVAAALGVGLVSCAEAHVFVGVGVGMPAFPVPVPAYVPPPVYYAPPPPPVYTAPVVIGYYGHPHGIHATTAAGATAMATGAVKART